MDVSGGRRDASAHYTVSLLDYLLPRHIRFETHRLLLGCRKTKEARPGITLYHLFCHVAPCLDHGPSLQRCITGFCCPVYRLVALKLARLTFA